MPALSLTALRARAEEAVAQGRAFTLSEAELGLDGAHEFFADHLGGDLVVRAPVDYDAGGLRLTGAVELAGFGVLEGVEVGFTADAQGQAVAGVRVAATLDTWEIDTPYLSVSLDGFRTGYGFDAAVLLIGAGSGPEGATGSWASAGLAFGVRSQRACLLVRGPDETGEFELYGAFSAGLGLPNLASLTELPGLAAVAAADLALPDEVPAPLGIAEVSLVCGVNPGAGGMRWTRLRAGLAGADWVLLPDVLALDGLSVTYGIGWDDPGLGLEPRCLVSAELGATLHIAGSTLAATVSLPELVVTAWLDSPSGVDEAELGERLAGSGIAAGVRVSALSAVVRVRDLSYTLSFALDTDWTFFDQVTVDAVALEVSGEGAAPDLVALTGALDIGGQPVLLEARRGFGTGWMMSVRSGSVELAGLAAWLEGTFSVPLPEAVSGLVLDGIFLTFQPETRSLALGCTGTFPLGEAQATLALDAHLARPQAGGRYEAVFEGRLSVATAPVDGVSRVLDFTVDHSSGAAGGTLTATWSGDPGIGAREVAAALGVSLPDGIPETLLPTLTSLALRRDAVTGRLLVASATQAGGGVVIASVPGEPAGLVLLVKAALPARLSDLPLVGGEIPAGADIGVSGVQLVVNNRGLTSQQIAAVNADLAAVEAASGQPYPRLPEPAEGLPPGGALTVPYDIAGQPREPLTLVLGGGTGLPAVRSSAGGARVSADVGRSFGPLYVHRISVGYHQGKVLVVFDAALGTAGLTVAALGLGLALDVDTMTVTPCLEGLSVDLDRPPLRVSGALVNRAPQPPVELMIGGMVVVQLPKLGITALGAYQRREGEKASLFLFGRATAPIGGPPPFRVTGLAAGFGFNTSLRIPEFDQVTEFPLVAGVQDGLPDNPLEVLDLLTGHWVTPRQGQIWGAAGVDFTSFEFISGRLLLTLEAGDDLTVALLGTARAAFPRTGRAYAKVALQLRIVYRSSRGEFAATALLHDSYVIDPSCVLTGGFAFFMWSGASDHAGDFALTAGGYHPLFRAPAHYPQVPRLGFSWSLGAVDISGTAFFALTPSAVMAGGTLDVRYSAGPLSAWLTAYAHLLISWKPLHFRAGIGIRIGAALKLAFVTVRGELSATLDLWGPPTGGRVTAKFTFIKVRIGFGAGETTAGELTWPEFTELLPPPEQVLRIEASEGLRADAEPPQGRTASDPDAPWLVDAGGFSFVAETSVPASRATFQDEDRYTGEALDIRPMGGAGAAKRIHFTVVVSRNLSARGMAPFWEPLADDGAWRAEPVLGAVPAALWGTPGAAHGDLLDPDQRLLHGRCTGLRVTVPPPVSTAEPLDPIASASLAYEEMPDAAGPLDPAGPPTGDRLVPAPGTGVNTVVTTVAAPATAQARGRLATALAGLLDPLPDAPLSAFAAHAAEYGLPADPLLRATAAGRGDQGTSI
ncbi:DUF6603 domain-containing protein [Streptomyces sp. CA-181903]|uniref:DUF6603 domain-containing protein n=1 Tax=Streptomyces sp. CA-181903 TaxID=3240055 RepID=UPI003D93D9D4